jgi:pilus assembly protein CpaB
MFIGVLALVLGALASLFAYRTLQQHSGANQGEQQEVVVAATDLPVGARVQDKDVRTVRFPSDAIPQGIFHFTKNVIGRGVILPIARGEFFISDKNLASDKAGSGLTSTIPQGMRAVSVRVSDISSVSGFVQRGARVDVLMTGTPGGSGEPQTITVLKNVAVLANGSNLDGNAQRESSQNAPIITLAVSPDDAQKLALATAQGRIQLALRNPMDTSQSDVAAIGMHSLYQKTEAPVPVFHPKPKPVTVTQAPAPPPTVEVIKGDKRDVTKVEE